MVEFILEIIFYKIIISLKMYKAILITKNEIKNHHSTLNRQIVCQLNEKIMYSPNQSPTKASNSDKKQQKRMNTLICYEQSQKYGQKVRQIQGQLKVFHEYQFQKNDEIISQQIQLRKKQQLSVISQLKSNILSVVNIFRKQDIHRLLEQLYKSWQQIQNIDLFTQKIKNSQGSQVNEVYHLIIYFKNVFISQNYYNLLATDFLLLPIILKEVIIVQRNQQEISYTQVMSFFKFTSIPSQNYIGLQKNDIYQKKWIQLPKCSKCLLRLEFQVSGIQDQILHIVSQNKSTLQICQTCKILQLHTKQVEIHRKLSYQEGFKDHKTQKHAHCDDCKQKTDIWICMVCTRVGCGRYKNADAYKHFVKSGHIIAIDLQTQRVWNYLSDCFSHKLLRNTYEHPLNVKFPDLGSQENQKIQQSTLEAAFWQYCSIFSQQMQRQRIFYENIKKSESQQYQSESVTLQKIIQDLQKQKQQKTVQLKKIVKQKVKMSKKSSEICQKVQNQRYLLKQYEDCLTRDSKFNLQKDQEVLRKKKQLKELQIEMQQVLIQLTDSS